MPALQGATNSQLRGVESTNGEPVDPGAQEVGVGGSLSRSALLCNHLAHVGTQMTKPEARVAHVLASGRSSQDLRSTHRKEVSVGTEVFPRGPCRGRILQEAGSGSPPWV